VFKERRDCYLQLRKIAPNEQSALQAFTPSSPRPGSSRTHSPDLIRTEVRCQAVCSLIFFYFLFLFFLVLVLGFFFTDFLDETERFASKMEQFG
jgi:hypothetical protein